MARREILEFHRIVQSEGEGQGGAIVFKVEYVRAWEAFRDGPTISTASALLDVAPLLGRYFEDCSPGGELFEMHKRLRHVDGQPR